jgi:hypothetical protein
VSWSDRIVIVQKRDRRRLDFAECHPPKSGNTRWTASFSNISDGRHDPQPRDRPRQKCATFKILNRLRAIVDYHDHVQANGVLLRQ